MYLWVDKAKSINFGDTKLYKDEPSIQQSGEKHYMKDKEKIFKHLQDKLTSVRDRENEEEIDELSKQVALARVFLRAEEKYHEGKSDKVEENCQSKKVFLSFLGRQNTLVNPPKTVEKASVSVINCRDRFPFMLSVIVDIHDPVASAL